MGAFGVKLKDPFPPARIAGINAFRLEKVLWISWNKFPRTRN